MTLIPNNLNFWETDIIKTLDNEIPRSLRSTALHLLDNTSISKKWFGDQSATWITELRIKLERLATLIARHNIYIFSIISVNDYLENYAIAYKPENGWKDFTSNEHYDAIMAQTKPVNIRIGIGYQWFHMPIYDSPCFYESKFQTLVHELSHLLMATKDHRLKFDRCKSFARTNSTDAKRNADNWGYFASECRLQHHTIIDDDGLESTRM
jgi:hypothetical protein